MNRVVMLQRRNNLNEKSNCLDPERYTSWERWSVLIRAGEDLQGQTWSFGPLKSGVRGKSDVTSECHHTVGSSDKLDVSLRVLSNLDGGGVVDPNPRSDTDDVTEDHLTAEVGWMSSALEVPSSVRLDTLSNHDLGSLTKLDVSLRVLSNLGGGEISTDLNPVIMIGTCSSMSLWIHLKSRPQQKSSRKTQRNTNIIIRRNR